MPYPTLSFATIADWLNWIDNNIVPNGMELITGNDGNITEHAAAYFISRSPLNWQTADIFSTGGDISPTRPVNVIMSVIPDSLVWGDNIYNQYVFINTTSGDIPCQTYYDINLTATNIVPAKSIVNVVKAKNSNWLVASVPSSGSLSSLLPLVGEVGAGGADDPVNGANSFQSNKLIGLASSSGGTKLSILYAETPYNSWGDNKSFDYDNVLGTITWLNGGTFTTGSSLFVDRNQ